MRTHVMCLLAAGLWINASSLQYSASAQEPTSETPPTTVEASKSEQSKLRPNAAAEAVEQLSGSWTIVAGVNQGRPVPTASLKGSQVTFGDNTIIVLDAEQKELYKAAFKLSGDKQPFKIDMTTELPNQPPTQAPGLIAFHEQGLRLCYALPGGQRPTDFESAEGSKHMLFEMKRTDADSQQTRSKTGAAARTEVSQVLISSNNLVGANVVDPQHRTLGVIDRLAISHDGQWAYAVVKIGAVLGVGGQAVAVPLPAIRTESASADEQTQKNTSWLIVDADIQHAPQLATADHLELSDAGWLGSNLDYFGVRAAEAEAPTTSVERTPEQQPKRTAEQLKESHAAHMIAVDQLINHEVYGSDGESLAYLDAVILKLHGQPCVPFAILGYGGLLGVGKDFVAVDFTKLQFQPSEDGKHRMTIALDAEQLAAQQKVTPDSYPELRLQSVLNRVSEP